MQSTHWALTQRPFYRNPKSSPDAGSFNCTVCGIVPRHKAGAIFPILSRLRHTTPIKARISLTCGSYRPFWCFFGCCPDNSTSQVLLVCGVSMVRYVDTYGLESKAVKLFSLIQLLTRQSIYIIIIVICSFRSGLHSRDCTVERSSQIE